MRDFVNIFIIWLWDFVNFNCTPYFIYSSINDNLYQCTCFYHGELDFFHKVIVGFISIWIIIGFLCGKLNSFKKFLSQITWPMYTWCQYKFHFIGWKFHNRLLLWSPSEHGISPMRNINLFVLFVSSKSKIVKGESNKS